MKVALVACYVPFVVVAVQDANRIKVEGPWLDKITLGSLIPFTRANVQWVIHGFN